MKRHSQSIVGTDRPQRRGGLLAIEARETTQRDGPGLAWIFRAEWLECLVRRRKILDRRRQRPVEVFHINTLFTAPTL